MQQDNNTESEVQTETQSLIEKFKDLPSSKKLAMVSFLSIMLCIIIFILFFTGEPSTPPKPKIQTSDTSVNIEPTIIAQPTPKLYVKPEKNDTTVVEQVKNKISELKPPTPPKLETIEIPKPTLVPLPIKPQQVANPKLPLPSNAVSNNDNRQPKQSSSIMAFGGGGGNDGSKATDNNKNDTQTKNSGFLGFDGGMIDNAILQPTSAQPIIPTKVNNDLKYTLLQGKVIDAVLETAINTQMTAGIVRAIISRDIYGEQGDLVLIPKGSRVIGGYNVSTSGGAQTGQVATRVYATWKRIITPSGVDINLPDMPATDPLGRSGIPGYFDTNLNNNLMNAFLVSVLGPYLAAVASGASKESTTTTTNNSSGTTPVGVQTTTTGTVGAQVLTQGMQQFQSVAQGQINAIYPQGVITIFINQGTKIDIIIQQDITFPKQAININTENLP